MKLSELSDSLHRRLSLRLSGYTRPPFMLKVDRRHRCLSFLTARRGQRGFFAEEDHGFPIETVGSHTPAAVYLWPDRLRWHFFFFGTFMAILLSFTKAFSAAIFVFSFLIFFVPWMTYSALRVPVLEDIWRPWPAFMSQWIKGIPQFFDQSICKPTLCDYVKRLSQWIKGIPQFFDQSICKLTLCDYVKRLSQWIKGIPQLFDRSRYKPSLLAYFPPIKEQWDAVYWSPQGSPQESMLRAAITDMFKAQGPEESSLFRGRAFSRWLFYWCAPLWGMYVALWLLLIPLNFEESFRANFFLCYDKETLYILAWAWMVFSLLFMWRESAELNRWKISQRSDDWRCLPPVVYRHVEPLSDVALKLSEARVLAIFSIFKLFAVGAYISLASACSPVMPMQKSPHPEESHPLRLACLVRARQAGLPERGHPVRLNDS